MGIEWRDSLAIGVEVIDKQHKELLSRFDRLLNACESGQGIEETKKLLTFLDEYVRTHFKDEEALQVQHRFPGLEAHRREHHTFMDQLNKLKVDVQKRGVSMHHIVETNNLLLQWLMNHIAKSDTAIGEHIKSTTR
jgi:hemerythrin